MVSNTLRMGLGNGVLMFQIRCTSCLDAYIKWDYRQYCLLCQMG